MVCIGYFYALSDTNGNILNNFDKKDPVINIGRGALGITVICNFPLLVLPCRVSYRKLIALMMQPREERAVAASEETITPSVSSLSASFLVQPGMLFIIICFYFGWTLVNENNNNNASNSS